MITKFFFNKINGRLITIYSCNNRISNLSLVLSCNSTLKYIVLVKINTVWTSKTMCTLGIRSCSIFCNILLVVNVFLHFLMFFGNWNFIFLLSIGSIKIDYRNSNCLSWRNYVNRNYYWLIYVFNNFCLLFSVM